MIWDDVKSPDHLLTWLQLGVDMVAESWGNREGGFQMEACACHQPTRFRGR